MGEHPRLAVATRGTGERIIGRPVVLTAKEEDGVLGEFREFLLKTATPAGDDAWDEDKEEVSAG